MGKKVKQISCFMCNKFLEKDHIALNKKLLGRHVEHFMCLNCLANYLDSNVDDLLVKIEEFKEQGCALFH